MIPVTDRIRQSLVSLHMARALETLDQTLSQLERGEISAIEAIDALLAEELNLREGRRIGVALRTARLMPIKTLESFDFSFQPSLDRNRIMALAQLEFIKRAEVLHFLGPPGTGKSHLATAIGVAAVKAGRSVYRCSLAELIEALTKAEREGRLGEKIRFYARASLLIVDEIGYLPITSGGANLFFQLVNARYEKGAMMGYRVLACDLDPQATLTNMFGVTSELDPDMPTAYDMIRNEAPVLARDVIQKTCVPNLDLIPASINVLGFEYETALSSRDPTLVAHALRPVLPNYDVVIFDTPPQLSFAVIAALFASNGVLIPLNASMLDVMSLASFLRMAGELMTVVETYAPDHGFDFVKILITRYDATDLPQVQIASFLRTVLGGSVMATEFVTSTAIGDAATTKQTLFEVEPRGANRKTYDRAIESIGRVTAEIEAEIGKVRGRRDDFSDAFRAARATIPRDLDIES